jgi:four helix bundle protein
MNQFSNKQVYDLEERTAQFGLAVIRLITTLNNQSQSIYNGMLRQCLRAATSIGANYMEANGASSKKDFRNKIYICKKESQETKHWLRMLSESFPDKQIELRALGRECQILTLIFQKITNSLKKKIEN